MTKILAVVVAGLAYGCGGEGSGGGSSGVPGNLPLGQLDPAQQDQLCTFIADTFPSRSVMCPDGSMVKVGGTKADCVAKKHPTTCMATVAQAESCTEAFATQTDDQICKITIPEACAPLFMTVARKWYIFSAIAGP
jgi:hypothetical protein